MKRGLEKFALVEEGMKSHSSGAAAAKKENNKESSQISQKRWSAIIGILSK